MQRILIIQDINKFGASLMSSLPSRSKTLIKAAKNYREADINVFLILSIFA